MITAFAPASVGNVTCGFDVLGMAVAQPGDEVTASFNDLRKVRITKITGDGGKLPTQVAQNTASIAVVEMLKFLEEKRGIDLFIAKKMPLGSGMGSSAASAVAAVVAVNALLGSPLTKEEMMPFVLVAEGFASGSVHGDNVLPCLLGGFILIQSYEPLRVCRLPVPKGLHCVLVHPDLKILTKEARAIIPNSVPLKQAISQTAHIAGFVDALYKEDFDLMHHSLKDHFAEPFRKSLITGFDTAKEAALAAGAINFGISGSGPSVYSFARDKATGLTIAEAIQQAFAQYDIESQSYVDLVNVDGASVIADS